MRSEDMETYIRPTIDVIDTEGISLMAASFDKNIDDNKTTDGYLSKENNGFMWDDDAWGNDVDDDVQ